MKKREVHGMRKSPEYIIWANARQRCTNPSNPGYADYGGRGIVMDEEFVLSFAAFYEHVGPRPSPKHMLDRIDNDSGYCHGNLRWVLRKDQNRNRRNTRKITFGGRTAGLSEWAEILGCNRESLKARLDRGWSVEEAFLTPTYWDGKSRQKVKEKNSKEQQSAYNAVYYALMKGVLVRPALCQHPGCRASRLQAHHHRGYAEEVVLDVLWLCVRHHRAYEYGRANGAINNSPAPVHVKKTCNRLITYKGQNHTMMEWSALLGIKYSTLKGRLGRGWPAERALGSVVN